jgi:hypothetical protein
MILNWRSAFCRRKGPQDQIPSCQIQSCEHQFRLPHCATPNTRRPSDAMTASRRSPLPSRSFYGSAGSSPFLPRFSCPGRCCAHRDCCSNRYAERSKGRGASSCAPTKIGFILPRTLSQGARPRRTPAALRRARAWRSCDAQARAARNDRVSRAGWRARRNSGFENISRAWLA